MRLPLKVVDCSVLIASNALLLNVSSACCSTCLNSSTLSVSSVCKYVVPQMRGRNVNKVPGV